MAISPSQLSLAQRQALKAHILADPALAAIASGPGIDIEGIRVALNANASPVTKAWKISVPQEDADDAPDYSTFDAIVAGKRDSWGFFLARSRDFTRNKVRKWITDIWGNATTNSNAEAILQAGTVNATRAEVVIGGTTRTTGTVSGLERTMVGELSQQDVSLILAS